MVLIAVTAAGCLGLGLESRRPAPAVREAALVGGAVIVTAPTGYCLEPGSVKSSAESGFALLGRCDLLTDSDTAPVPVAPAILTISVTAGEETGVPADGDSLARALGEERILERIEDNGLVLFRVDSAEPVTRSGDSRHWRAMMAVNGHTVGLAAYGAEGSNISGESGQYLLRALARRIRKASPEPPPAQADHTENDKAE
ncbi:hypothetical protein [Sediminimonas sp.]|uniref:hypothetical protein n=1 Tax=Sediminimonas sp. TaxID=2823379 RepID=UPI0025FB6F66|nr:hypothetical protein [Sediminimonas sp.]